jgi:hypothetical protein
LPIEEHLADASVAAMATETPKKFHKLIIFCVGSIMEPGELSAILATCKKKSIGCELPVLSCARKRGDSSHSIQIAAEKTLGDNIGDVMP